MIRPITQSAYDGASPVYGRNKTLEYFGSDPPGYRVVSNFTFDGTSTDFFAHYTASSKYEEGEADYHQYHIASTNDKFKRRSSKKVESNPGISKTLLGISHTL
jgi:hypothetical protein